MTNTILYFHTGRGGHFHNCGHISYCGQKTIEQVLQMNDSGNRHSFFTKENYSEIYGELKERGLDNLLELLENCSDNDDFTSFEKKTGVLLGDNVYSDSNGNIIITEKEVESGVGILNWDNEYDTDECMLLSDCGETELKIILKSYNHDKFEVVQEYFENCTNEKIDWMQVNEEKYFDLVDDFFNQVNFNPEDYFTEEIEEAN